MKTVRPRRTQGRTRLSVWNGIVCVPWAASRKWE
jgi:hypothetical protein